MRADGRVLGSLIGLVGGEVFVQANAAELPGETPVRVAGLVLGLLVVATLVRYLRSSPIAPPPPSRSGLRLYGVTMIALVVSIPVGAAVLRALDHADLTPVWVVLVLGLHFLPFARAFGQPFFARLGWTLVGIAVAGCTATLAGVDDGPAWTAVLAGATLLVASLLGTVSSRSPA
jgi:hypothetical protein